MRLALALLLVPLAAGAAPAAGMPRCAAAQLRVALGPAVSARTGERPLTLRVVERRGPACVLRGYPRVRVADTRGALPFRILHGGGQTVTTAAPRPIVLAPGSAAFVVLSHYRCDAGVERSGVLLVVGSRLLSLPRARRIDWCGRGDPGSTLHVSPYESTLLAALRR